MKPLIETVTSKLNKRFSGVQGAAFQKSPLVAEGKKMNNVIAVIPARAGSKRVKNKNTRQFMNRPLVAYSIIAAQRCPGISRIIVSTDDARVSAIAREYGVEVLPRPAELAGDKASTFDVLKQVYHHVANEGNGRETPQYLVLLQPTSPLREENLISRGLNMMQADAGASSLISVFEHKVFTGKIKERYWVPDYPENTRSQDIPPSYVPTGNLYIYRCGETILKNDALGLHTLPLVEDFDKIVNIDHEHDFVKLKYVCEIYGETFSYLLQS